MHALVYNGPGHKRVQDHPKPAIKTIANVGVHGVHSVHSVQGELHLETLWSHNMTITTGLVDTFSIPMLLKTVRSRPIDATQMITHRFTLANIMAAYETFGSASNPRALKVIKQA